MLAVLMPDIETCRNCGELIGRLETAAVWRGNVVCMECRRKLESEGMADWMEPEGPPPARVIPYASVPASGALREPRRYGDPLKGPRIAVLLASVALTLAGGREFAFLAWASWVALGVASLVLRASRRGGS